MDGWEQWGPDQEEPERVWNNKHIQGSGQRCMLGPLGLHDLWSLISAPKP